jgi:cyclin-dependent kinase
LLRSASDSEDYQAKIQEAVEAIGGSQLSDEAEEDSTKAEILNMEGPTFGKYQYATYHADGIMSTVFKAQAKDDHRIVAIKVTHPSTMTAPHDSEREARLLIKARHDNVVPLLDTVREAAGRFVLVFPFLRQDLENLLRSGNLSKKQTSMIFEGLFSALEHIHAQGMIHRDIKPSNILLKSMDGPVYLIDFGIAWSPNDKDSEPAHSKITDVGTACYRPPEILFGNRAYNTSLDMWAAGCVVAEMLRKDHKPLFDAGDLGSELSLIKSIFTTLGTPNEEIWPSSMTCPDWGKMRFQHFTGKTFQELLPGALSEAIDFVSRTVCFEQSRRLTAGEALRHELREILSQV